MFYKIYFMKIPNHPVFPHTPDPDEAMDKERDVAVADELIEAAEGQHQRVTLEFLEKVIRAERNSHRQLRQWMNEPRYKCVLCGDWIRFKQFYRGDSSRAHAICIDTVLANHLKST